MKNNHKKKPNPNEKSHNPKVYNPNTDLHRGYDEDNEPNFNLISEIDEYGIHKSRPKSYIEKEHKKYGYSVNTLTGQPVNKHSHESSQKKKQSAPTVNKIWRPDGETWQPNNNPQSNKQNNHQKKNHKSNKPTNKKLNTGSKPNKPFKPKFDHKNKPKSTGEHRPSEAKEDALRLNKFLSQQGIASRRKADELIESGKVKINGRKVTDLGTKIDPKKDHILVDGQQVANFAEKLVYFILNKPKDTITTRSDEKDRHTVMDYIDEEFRQKVVPVGRLDRDTTGILLLCNDGDLIHRLTHPSYEIPRTYHAVLDKSLSKADLNRIAAGVELEDGTAAIHSIEYVPNTKDELYLTLSEGKNREIRRLFEFLGYEVLKLDRMSYAGMTCEGLQRGESRSLNKKEISYLKALVKL